MKRDAASSPLVCAHLGQTRPSGGCFSHCRRQMEKNIVRVVTLVLPVPECNAQLWKRQLSPMCKHIFLANKIFLLLVGKLPCCPLPPTVLKAEGTQPSITAQRKGMKRGVYRSRVLAVWARASAASILLYSFLGYDLTMLLFIEYSASSTDACSHSLQINPRVTQIGICAVSLNKSSSCQIIVFVLADMNGTMTSFTCQV